MDTIEVWLLFQEASSSLLLLPVFICVSHDTYTPLFPTSILGWSVNVPKHDYWLLWNVTLHRKAWKTEVTYLKAYTCC